jgi:hypothetical protein
MSLADLSDKGSTALKHLPYVGRMTSNLAVLSVARIPVACDALGALSHDALFPVQTLNGQTGGFADTPRHAVEHKRPRRSLH